MQRARSGRRIELTQRDLAIFEILMRYRYLRSTYLHAFVGGASETRFKERLGDLFHEGYVDRPQQQWEFADARCRPVVYEIAKKSRAAFHALGRANAGVHRRYHRAETVSPCCHDLRSIGLAGVSGARLQRTSLYQLAGDSCARTRRDPTLDRTSKPPCGLWRRGCAGRRLRARISGKQRKAVPFFALEADRGTMPIMRTRSSQTSYLAKLAAYHEVLAQQAHKSRWAVPNLLVLTLTTSEARTADIIARLGEARASFLFKAAVGKELVRPAFELLHAPGQRAGHPPLCIAVGA